MKALPIALMIASTALAQVDGGSIAGPVLGLVSDADGGSIRPLLGVPGSSIVGAALDSGSGLRNATAFAAGYGMGLDADGLATIVTAAGRRPIPGAGMGAARFIVSPSGSAAALYFAESTSAQIFTGMPGAPQPLRTVALDSPAAAMALSDDGGTLLVVSHSGRGEMLYSYHAGDAPQIVYRAPRITALAFVPGGSDALVAEPMLVQRISPAFGAQPLGGGALADVVAVAASSDASRVMIATRRGRVVVHDLASGAETSLSCACEPQTLAPLRGKAVFRLNEMGHGALWVLDADSAEARIVFVAAPAQGSAQ